MSFQHRAVIRGRSKGAIAPPEFGDSEKRTKIEIHDLLLSSPPQIWKPNNNSATVGNQNSCWKLNLYFLLKWDLKDLVIRGALSQKLGNWVPQNQDSGKVNKQQQKNLSIFDTNCINWWIVGMTRCTHKRTTICNSTSLRYITLKIHWLYLV